MEEYCCFSKGESVGLTVTDDGVTFIINSSSMSKDWFTNSLKTYEGPTVGEKNRELVHHWLDNFIDKLIGEK